MSPAIMEHASSMREVTVDFYRRKPHVFEALESARDKRDRSSFSTSIPIEKMRSFLEENADVRRLDKDLTAFNVFIALDATDYETRHSNFLAWLLDPAQSHGFGPIFLQEFLRRAVKNASEQSVHLPDAARLVSLDSAPGASRTRAHCARPEAD